MKIFIESTSLEQLLKSFVRFPESNKQGATGLTERSPARRVMDSQHGT
jgi:hypothetical protein